MRIFALAFALTMASLAATPALDKGKAMGVPTAPVTIEIFSSFDCSHCKDLHEEVVPQLRRDFVDAGKVYLVDREFPLPGHPLARTAANYATAAARVGKYRAVSEALYRDQAKWAVNGKVWDTVAGALTPAEQKKVQALAADPGVIGEVDTDMNQAMLDHIEATPLMVLTSRGKRYSLPNVNYELLKSLIESTLK